MNRIIRIVLATQFKTVLIKRLLDTILLKMGAQRIKTLIVPQKYKRSKIKVFQLHTSGNPSVFEKKITENMMQNILCILSDEWHDFLDKKNDGQRIDWQTDYKSGYTFRIDQTSSCCLNDIPDGVDIKTPWELARMQHLPFLARLTSAGQIEKEKGCSFFRETVIDFITNNPIGYGVNWACPMDVAIRAINILVAYDYLSPIGQFDIVFLEQLSFSIVEHGAFIYRNLEKNFTEDKSGNHYLADLCGLIVIGSHIQESIGKCWLRFAADELFKEIDKQIFEDGGNYEFSTAYHRLDSEIIAVATAFLVSAGFEIPDKVSIKIHKMLVFMNSILYSDGQIVQIGDNDSGHLLRLSYHGHVENDKPAVDELNGQAAVDLLLGLFTCEGKSAEHMFIRSLMREKVLKWEENSKMKYEISAPAPNDFQYKMELKIQAGGSEDIRIKLFPDFGLAVLKNNACKVFFRLPTEINRGKAIHIHSDFLHFEYESNHIKHFRDRGSYTYSGDIEKRNLFRSARFHNVPQYSTEQNIFTGVWGIKHIVAGSWRLESEHTITAFLNINEVVHLRKIHFKDGILTIIDESNMPFDKGYFQGNIDSTGYGIITTNHTMEN